MKTTTVTNARADLYNLIDRAAESGEPVTITGKSSNAMLISEDDWLAIQESSYLLSVPDMQKSIRKGLAADPDECAEELEW